MYLLKRYSPSDSFCTFFLRMCLSQYCNINPVKEKKNPVWPHILIYFWFWGEIHSVKITRLWPSLLQYQTRKANHVMTSESLTFVQWPISFNAAVTSPCELQPLSPAGLMRFTLTGVLFSFRSVDLAIDKCYTVS